MKHIPYNTYVLTYKYILHKILLSYVTLKKFILLKKLYSIVLEHVCVLYIDRLCEQFQM